MGLMRKFTANQAPIRHYETELEKCYRATDVKSKPPGLLPVNIPVFFSRRIHDLPAVLEKPEILCTETDAPVSSQKSNEICGKMDKTTGHVFPTKIERIEDLHINLLYEGFSNVNKNIGHRKMIAGLDLEKKIEIDESNILKSEKREKKEWIEVCSKSARKRHRKRMNKLIGQLSTCNLEDNSVKHDSLNNKKLKKNGLFIIHRGSQKMKKIKEKEIDPNILKRLKNQIEEASLASDLLPCNGPNDYPEPMKRLEIFFDKEAKIRLEKRTYGRCGNKGDSVKPKIELNLELKNSTEENKVTYKLHKDGVGTEGKLMNLETKKQQDCADCDLCKYADYLRYKERSTSKSIKDLLREDTFPSPLDEMELTKQYLHKINDKIQKKKDQPDHLKHVKKTTEELKGENLTRELNSVIKNLMAVDLTQEVNANTIKKKPTQTHLTPV